MVYGQNTTEDNRECTATSGTDVLQIFTVLNVGKLRGCEKPISLINAKSASDFSIRRNTIVIAPLRADVP